MVEVLRDDKTLAIGHMLKVPVSKMNLSVVYKRESIPILFLPEITILPVGSVGIPSAASDRDFQSLPVVVIKANLLFPV